MSARIKLLAPLLVAVFLLAVPALANAHSISWNKAVRIEPAKDGGLNAVSCPGTKFCVAADQSGDVLYSTKPNGGAWSAPARVDTAGPLRGISCPTTKFCAAVDQVGALVWSTTPTLGAKHWSHPVRIDPTASAGGGYVGLAAISCPSASLCVAVDNAPKANIVYSTDPKGGKSAWHTIALSGPATSVSCPSTSLCVVGGTKRYISTDPTSTTGWKAAATLSGGVYQSVDCATTTLCAAAGFGNTTPGLASASTSPTGSWSTPVTIGVGPSGTPPTGGGVIDAVGCTRGWCVALDGADNVYVSSKPAGNVWTTTAKAIRPKSASQWNAVSCIGGQCVVVDSAGVETTGILK